MNNNSKFDRYFVVLGGATMTSGGSLNLAKGQMGVFSDRRGDKNGLQAIGSFAGRDKDENYLLKVGRAPIAPTRSTTNKSKSSVPFSLRDVKKLTASAPKSTEQKVDDVILGYDGIDANTAITLIRADLKKITVELSGELIGMYGYSDNRVVTTVYLDPKKFSGTELCTDGDNCEAVNARPYVLEAIEQLRRFQIKGGVEMQELVDITPVDESTGGDVPVTEDRFFQSLTVVDGGDQAAFAQVQAQYPNNKLVRTNLSGITSTYETMTETNALLTAYVSSLASLIKGCEDCPAGYTELAEGFVYNVKIEDDGVDLSTTVDDLPGFIAGTVDKIGQDGGKGIYTLVLTAELTDAQLATFVAATAVKATAEVKLVGEVTALCANGATTSTAWVLGETCQVSTDLYTIVLADDECGDNRLLELQGAYPQYDITVAEVASANSAQTVTLTGTSGTANITIAGTNYLATFATSLTQTATNFVTTHAAAILTATGATVTSAGAVITITDATTGFPTVAIANVTTNLAGTVGAVAVIDLPATGGCQTRYQAEVVTNMVCEECSDIFRDFFTSEAPEAYEGIDWALVEPAEPTSSLMGIRFRGKKLEIRSNEFLRDKIGFTDSSVQIRVSGGHIDEVRSGIGELKDEPMAVTYLERWAPRTHLGGNFQWLEQRDEMYFSGENFSTDAMTRVLFTGQESALDQSKQYVDYALHIHRSTHAQHPSGVHNEDIVYHVLVEYGRHLAVENVLNNIAGAAGIAGARVSSQI